jgi:hypothetical protein
LIVYTDLCGQFREQDFSLQYGYFWITLILNLSISYALVTLVLFYNTLRAKLLPFDPLPKFLCVKAIVFFAFWQVTYVQSYFKWVSDDAIQLYIP